MTLKTNVLVENICNLSEARYCSGMGVQFLACPAAQVDPTLFMAIKGWVQGPEMVVDISESAEHPDLNAYEADFILVNSNQLSATANKSPLPFMVRLNADDLLNLDQLAKYFERIQFVIIHEASKNEIDKLSALKYKIIVSVDKKNSIQLTEILDLPIAGILLTGETETAPGLKNYDHLSSVLEELEVEDY
ncbi:MAG: hypothetical protein HOP37_00510 [Cyclobacteriaceae bacterium]|nr:hypothetical protein [Cyclobacteriaceae bacterium]